VVFRQPGTPTVGKEKNFPALKTLATLTAPWEVAFDPQWGGPEHVVFPRLMDWTEHPEEGIKHYSGTATYRTAFELSESDLLATKAGLFLDLEDVRSLATVRLNGQELGTLWTPPWHVDIARAAKIGSNTLEVVIINTWNNRLAGDHKLPEEQRRTWLYEDSAWSQMSLNSEKLLPAGLLGPVTLQNEINKEDSE
jgi:hypothetical protein